MGEMENTAMRIFHAYEDYYLDKDKRIVFEDLFDSYLTGFDMDGRAEPYDAMVTLGQKHPDKFDAMVKILKDRALISD